MSPWDENSRGMVTRVMLYKETRWQRFKRKVLRRKTWWEKGTEKNPVYTNRAEIVFPPATGSQVITHVTLWDDSGNLIGQFPIEFPKEGS